MEPSLPSSYKKTLALAYLRVILNEYWSIGIPWARSSTMQRIRSYASFIKVGVANAQMGVALKFSRAFNRTLLWLILDPPLILNEYWSIGKPWARSSTMQRIRSCASFIKVGVANAQIGVALKFSRALCALSSIESSFG